MIKYFVRTTGERQLDSSYSQIEYELLIDKEYKPIKSFIEQLEFINNYDSVLLEDDLILCKDFKNRIEKIINENKNKIINFFTLPNGYFQTKISNCFSYNQCTYYPKGISKLIAKEMKILLQENNYTQYDSLENRALRKLKITHLVYRPCLVQHLDKESIMNKDVNYSRKTPYFIDYLDELGIDYKEANKKENKDKLINLLNSIKGKMK